MIATHCVHEKDVFMFTELELLNLSLSNLLFRVHDSYPDFLSYFQRTAAEFLLTFALEKTLTRVSSMATERIGLAWGLEGQLQKLC